MFFEWTGFKSINLKEWESHKLECKDESDLYCNYPEIFETPEYPQHPYDLKWRVNECYIRSFVTLDITYAEDIENTANEIYTLLQEGYKYYSDDYKKVYFYPPVGLVLTKSITFTSKDELEQTRIWNVLSLMLLDIFITKDEFAPDKYTYLADSIETLSIAIKDIMLRELRTNEAKLKARKRHKVRDQVHSYAIELLNVELHKFPNKSKKQLALSIFEKTKNKADELNYPYTDRFEQTVYEWVLKSV
jgi:hypothetical protein